MNVQPSLSKSVFPSLHRSLRVPAALLGASGFDIEAGLQSRYLDESPYFTDPVSNRYFIRDTMGSTHARFSTPCLNLTASTNAYCSIGLFDLSGDFELSCWLKYEGSASDTNGAMFIGGGLSGGGSGYRGYLWYRPSTGIWTFAANGEASKLTVTDSTIEDNQWHKITLSRTGTTHRLYIDTTLVKEQTSTVTLFSLRHLMMSYTQGYSLAGQMADFRLTVGGVTYYFPLQDGPGDGTNRNISWVASDGTGGVITDALVGYSVAGFWGASCPGYAKDWSIEYGGKLAANGSFIPGMLSGDNAADGTSKTLAVGKRGNPSTTINLNPSWTQTLIDRLAPVEMTKGQNINSFMLPVDSAFSRTSSDGDDRILIYSSAKTGANLAGVQDYTGVTSQPTWTLADLPGDIADEYIALIATNGGTISAGNQTAVRNLLNGLHTQGLFDDVLALYLFHGNHLDSAKINAMNPGSFGGAWNITWVGTPTLNASGGITPSDGNYGVAFHPDGMGLTDLTGGGLGFYSTSNSATSERTMGHDLYFHLSPKYSGNSVIAAANIEQTGAVQDLSGFHFACREPNSTNIKGYRNGTEYFSNTRDYNTAYVWTEGYCHVGGCNTGSANSPSTTPIRLALCTKGLLAAQVTALNTLVQAYISELV